MFCTNCKNDLPVDSNFCVNCGTKVEHIADDAPKDNKSIDRTDRQEKIHKKFAEIFSAKDEEKEKYDKFISEQSLVAINNTYKGFFDQLFDDIKDREGEISNMPLWLYRKLRGNVWLQIKGGLQLMMAKKIIDKEKLATPKFKTPQEKFDDEWGKIYDKVVDNLDDVIKTIVVKDAEILIDNLKDQNEEMGNFPVKFVEALKSKYMWGTFVGISMALVEEKLKDNK